MEAVQKGIFDYTEVVPGDIGKSLSFPILSKILKTPKTPKTPKTAATVTIKTSSIIKNKTQTS